MTGPSDTLLARIDRMESMQAIQQLPIRYALAVDGIWTLGSACSWRM